MANAQIEQFQQKFDRMNIHQKKDFIQKLEDKLKGSSNVEWRKFLEECKFSYDLDVIVDDVEDMTEILPQTENNSPNFVSGNAIHEKHIEKQAIEKVSSPAQTVFARWATDGYYYPATIKNTSGNNFTACFLDGDTGQVSTEQIIDLPKAFKSLILQSNQKNEGKFYDCVITKEKPLTVCYKGGAVEQIDVKQLRGSKAGDKVDVKGNNIKKLLIGVASLILVVIAFNFIISGVNSNRLVGTWRNNNNSVAYVFNSNGNFMYSSNRGGFSGRWSVSRNTLTLNITSRSESYAISAQAAAEITAALSPTANRQPSRDERTYQISFTNNSEIVFTNIAGRTTRLTRLELR